MINSRLSALRRAIEALPDGASITLPRDALLAVLTTAGAERSEVASIPDTPERLITVNELAARLRVSTKHVYDHADEWPFTRRQLGAKALRFSEKGLERWLAGER